MRITVFYKLGTTTAVDCGAGTPIISVGGSINCVATVTRVGGANTPTGSVNWTTDSTGTFTPASCTLSGSGGTATCSVSYTPTLIDSGTHKITATYPGDANFTASEGYQNVTVNEGGFNPPVIISNGGGSTASIFVPENTTAVTTVTATDADGGTLVYSIDGGADAAKFSIDSATGVLTFVSAPNYEAPTDVGLNNVYEVVVKVTDPTALFDTQAITVTVTNVNEPPEITESDPQTVSMIEDTPGSFSLTLHATDPDAATPNLYWNISVGAANGLASASSPGFSSVISYTPNPNHNGSDSFTVQVSDGLGGLDTIVVNVNITPVADTYYVDNTNPAASDANPGTSPALPFATITRGAAVARAGDTVNVLAGTYAETVWLNVYSGRAGYPITFHAEEGVKVTGNGSALSGSAFQIAQTSYITIDGFEINGTAYKGIFATAADHIIISNNYITDSGRHVFGEHQQGIHFKTVTNSTITGNITSYNSCIGIRLTHQSNSNVISNNISFGNKSAVNPGEVTDAAGIELDDSDGNLVIHNVVYGNEDSGINMYISSGDGSNNNQIIGNLVYGNGDHGIDNNSSSGQIIVGNTVHGNYTSGINLENNSPGATIANNIVMDNGLNPAEGRKPGNVYVDGTSISGTNLDYNLYYRTAGTIQIKWNGLGFATLAEFKTSVPGQEVHGLEGNPNFVAPAPVAVVPLVIQEGNYHLLPLSPAIDSANSAAPGQPDTDLDGYARVDDPDVPNTGAGTRLYDDRGAYEKQINPVTILTVEPVTNIYGNFVNLTASLVPALSGKTIAFKLNNVAACSGTTNASGVATCNLQLLTDVGNYPTGVSASFAGDGMYLPSSGTAQLIVNPRGLTVTATGVDKVYDGTTIATVTLADNRIPGDVFTASYASAAFSDKNVGTGKVVTVTGISISGTDAVNYNLLNTSAEAAASISLRDLTITATGVDKVYDGTAAATVILADNRIPGDVFTASYASATFADKNVGTGKAVTVTGISISGLDAGNYTLLNTGASTTASITSLHITGSFTAESKVYDGATAAVVLSRSLTGVIPPDVVALSGGTAAFADKNVGTAKTVTLTGAVLTGADAGNYILDSVATTTANITPLHITGSFTADSKVYDGTTDAVVLSRSLTGVIGSDVVALSGGIAAFADKNVGTAKIVTLTGAALTGTDAGNYVLASVATTTANITKRDLMVTATGVDKVYDGTTTATVTLSDDRIPGDVFTASYTNAVFADANAAMNIPIAVTGISISGVDAGNYNLLNTTAETLADITPKPITVTANSGQFKFKGQVDPVFTYSFLPNDPPIVFTGALSREPGEEVGTYEITIGTLTAGSNYTILFISADFRIVDYFRIYLPITIK